MLTIVMEGMAQMFCLLQMLHNIIKVQAQQALGIGFILNLSLMEVCLKIWLQQMSFKQLLIGIQIK